MKETTFKKWWPRPDRDAKGTEKISIYIKGNEPGTPNHPLQCTFARRMKDIYGDSFNEAYFFKTTATVRIGNEWVRFAFDAALTDNIKRVDATPPKPLKPGFCALVPPIASQTLEARRNRPKHIRRNTPTKSNRKEASKFFPRGWGKVMDERNGKRINGEVAA